MHLIRNTFKRVALGISGGVDSAVSALLLKKKGFDVTGVFMKNWDPLEESGNCSYNYDLEDAEWLCTKLEIPFKVVDFVKDYWNDVFVKFIDEYIQGFTPNPDVLCNKYIKFNKFFDYSINYLNCDAIATGHYANSSFGNFLEYYKSNSRVQLLKAKDVKKDQTFFLCQIPQLALQKTMFPVGNLMKSEVKQIAHENELHRIYKKRESVGICFIGSRNFKEFISEYVPKYSGRIIHIESGKQIGTHSGVHHWGVGQRFRIAGFPKRTYIAQKTAETQDVLVVSGHDHEALYIKGLETEPPHWICDIPESLQDGRNSVFTCDFRFQHTHPLLKCDLVKSSEQGLIINLEKPLSSVCAGQFIVFYKENECIGGAKIIRCGPSLFTLGETVTVL
ncbi:mitochondrial tRNA-specific 2-thiouridylase 1 [Lycorma delicatula]|uniref:mitochondrial tRNA-specific 2-thiouridylase 1 n=1 Tax=Lycorma delicatula TaxID=130591 RepID=UPI003F50E217